LIPTKDHTDDLDLCMMSVAEKSTYKNIEFIVIENNSELDETFEYYERLTNQKYSKDKVLESKLPTGNTVKVVTWKDGFNYSAINNFGFKYASGEMILLLNNDTEIISEESIRELVDSCMLPHVGAAGAMLYYEDDTIQHGGVVYKIGGFAANVMTDEIDKPEWYYPWKVVPHEMSCCTAACLMMRRQAFEAAGLLDENLVVALNDVDLCMKIRKAGYNVIFNPHATFHHYESKSRGSENENSEKQKRFEREIKYFQNKWQDELDAGDPYYNVNMTLHKADYSVECFEDNSGRYSC
jgi:GT2 family glycosyltransferase